MRYLVIVIASFFISQASAADEKYDHCIQRAENATAFIACGVKHVESMDAALNKIWREVYRTVPSGPGKAALLNEQRHWIRFKDSANYYWHDVYGSMGRHVYAFTLSGWRIYQRRKSLVELARFADVNYQKILISDKKAFWACSESEAYPKSVEGRQCVNSLLYTQETDKELNRIWWQIEAEWHHNDYEQAWQALLAEQQQWLAFRDNACQYFTLEIMTRFCIGDLTVERSAELRFIFRPEENPLEFD